MLESDSFNNEITFAETVSGAKLFPVVHIGRLFRH